MKLDKINFIGFIEGNTGYSILSRLLISLMDYAGLDVRVENLYGTMIPQFGYLQNKDPQGRFNLLHQIPTVNPMADGFYTVTEFDEPPYGSISPLHRAKLVLTESNFCKKIFKNFTDAEIHVVHYPLDEQFKPKGPKYKFNEEIKKFRFKFLSVFEWIMRKDPYTLIKAFTEEFKPHEDVCLILRTWSKFENPQKWIGLIGHGHNVFWMPQDVPHLAPLYRACDCFISTTLGEGFGHPIIEAAACGLKVIAPRSTGILDYLNDQNSLLVDCHETTVANSRSFKVAGNELDVPNHPFGLIKPWFKVWEPDIDFLKAAMRKAYESDLKFITNKAADLRKKFNYDHSLTQIKKAFEL